MLHSNHTNTERQIWKQTAIQFRFCATYVHTNTNLCTYLSFNILSNVKTVLSQLQLQSQLAIDLEFACESKPTKLSTVIELETSIASNAFQESTHRTDDGNFCLNTKESRSYKNIVIVIFGDLEIDIHFLREFMAGDPNSNS
uniref:Uncharacterized protein n=1 Tax=Glossina pallidipes TaxID=7398 RepID=A0A1B0AIN8_GLOPL